MCDMISPYTPGAGFMPNYLAGRETNIDTAVKYIRAVIAKYPQQSVVYYGLRGVGKTVLLNAIESSVDNLDALYKHIEVRENGNFLSDLVAASHTFISQMSLRQNLSDLVKKALGIVKAFSMTYDPENQTFSASIKDDYIPYAVSGNMSTDLVDLLVAVGKVADGANKAVCYFIDEIQYATVDELEALIAAIHRTNQLRLPVIMFGAGLPKILKMMGDAKTYSERLFRFEEIGSLDISAATFAITEPAREFGVTYGEDALHNILNVTEGYPYFIQQICGTIWEQLEGDVVTVELVEKSVPLAMRVLDKSFFMVRYDRCTRLEKTFIVAMTQCGGLPCTVANVAHVMQRTVKAISPTRGSLIAKGLIYATQHGEIDFTVPQFDKFIKRITSNV